jgi:uncharacterized protein YacL
VAERIALFVVRGFFLLVSAGLGIYAHSIKTGERPGTDATSYIVVACALALAVIVVEVFSARTRVSAVASVTFGLVLGLLLSLLFRPVALLVLEAVGSERDEEVLRFVNLVMTVLLCYFSVTLFLHMRGRYKFLIPFVEFRKEVKEHRPLILDTSMLVDGRIGDLLASGLIKCRVLAPRFVVEELHALADSAEKVKRERGRQGLEILDALRRRGLVEVIPATAASGQVDVAILDLAQSLGGWVLTTDATLKARAKAEDAEIVNVNEVAEALRLKLVPGECLSVAVLRRGDAEGQGVGFLPDGTMVVIEGGRDAVGRTVSAEVTGTIRTSAGRLVFAKLVDT